MVKNNIISTCYSLNLKSPESLKCLENVGITESASTGLNPVQTDSKQTSPPLNCVDWVFCSNDGFVTNIQIVTREVGPLI